jgi:hypothetical protein
MPQCFGKNLWPCIPASSLLPALNWTVTLAWGQTAHGDGLFAAGKETRLFSVSVSVMKAAFRFRQCRKSLSESLTGVYFLRSSEECSVPTSRHNIKRVYVNQLADSLSWFLAWLNLSPRRWRRYIGSKHWDISELHSVIIQKTALINNAHKLHIAVLMQQCAVFTYFRRFFETTLAGVLYGNRGPNFIWSERCAVYCSAVIFLSFAYILETYEGTSLEIWVNEMKFCTRGHFSSCAAIYLTGTPLFPLWNLLSRRLVVNTA